MWTTPLAVPEPSLIIFGGLLPLPDDALTRWLMWLSLAFTSLPVLMPTFYPSLTAEIMARTIISMWLYGGLLMLAALARGAWHATTREAPAAEPMNAVAS